MAGITGPQLCELVEMGVSRFETLRHRSRQKPQRDNGEIEPFFRLVKDHSAGWVRYDFEDALNLKLAMELEALGMSLDEAAMIVGNGNFTSDPQPDLWIGRMRHPGEGMIHELGQAHVTDTLAGHAKRAAANGATSLILVNVQNIVTPLRLRAYSLGLERLFQ